METTTKNSLEVSEIKFLRKLLMGKENKIIRELLINQRDKVLQDQLIIRENKVMCEFVKFFDITPMQIVSKNKSSTISEIRYLYCKLRYENHGLTYSEVAREVDRKPATVRYGVNRINELLSYGDKRIITMWNRIKDISGFYMQSTASAEASGFNAADPLARICRACAAKQKRVKGEE